MYMAALPVYEMKISADAESELQVTAIALVDVPAIERNFFAFKDQPRPFQFSTINNDEQIIIGPAMIPDMLIYRNDPQMGEFNVFFTKETIQQIAEKFFKKCMQGNANIMHDKGQPVKGITYFMSWFKDDAKKMIGIEGDYPDGTWFVGARVTDANAWAKIKSGEIQGFSVEGWFEYLEEPAPEEMMLQEIKDAAFNLSTEEAYEKIKFLINEKN